MGLFSGLFGKNKSSDSQITPLYSTEGQDFEVVGAGDIELEGQDSSIDKQVTNTTDSKNKVDDAIMDEVVKTSFLRNILFESDGKGGLQLKQTVTDVSFNGTDLRVQDNEKGRYVYTDKKVTAEDVKELGLRLAVQKNKTWNGLEPILDSEVSTIRVNFMELEVSPYGETMALRISHPRLATSSLDSVCDDKVAKLIDLLMRMGINVMISGQTGSGKTELQKTIVGSIPDQMKITLAEDTMDSHLKVIYPKKDINSWQIKLRETGKSVDFSKLIKSGLRNNPDWFLISEIRGDEAFDLLDAGLTGHYFCSTVHAIGAAQIPSRMIQMIARRYPNLNQEVLMQDIASTLGLGIHMEAVYLPDGSIERRIREVVEYTGYEPGRGVVSEPLFARVTDYDEATGDYIDRVVHGKLSEELKGKLRKARMYHEIPDVFIAS